MSSAGKRSFLDALGAAATAPKKKQEAPVAPPAAAAETSEVKVQDPVEVSVKATPAPAAKEQVVLESPAVPEVHAAAEDSSVTVVPAAGGAWGRSGSLAKTLQQKTAPATTGAKRNPAPATSEKAKKAENGQAQARTTVAAQAGAGEGIPVHVGATVPVSPVAAGADLPSPSGTPSKLAAKSDPIVVQNSQLEKQLLVLPDDIQALVQPEGAYRFDGKAAATSSSPMAPPPMGDGANSGSAATHAPAHASPAYPQHGHGHGPYVGHSDRPWAHQHHQEEGYGSYDHGSRGGYQGHYPHHGGQRYNGPYDGSRQYNRMPSNYHQGGYDRNAPPFVPQGHQAPYPQQQQYRQFTGPPNYTPMNHGHGGRGGMSAPPPYMAN